MLDVSLLFAGAQLLGHCWQREADSERSGPGFLEFVVAAS